MRRRDFKTELSVNCIVRFGTNGTETNAVYWAQSVYLKISVYVPVVLRSCYSDGCLVFVCLTNIFPLCVLQNDTGFFPHRSIGFFQFLSCARCPWLARKFYNIKILNFRKTNSGSDNEAVGTGRVTSSFLPSYVKNIYKLQLCA